MTAERAFDKLQAEVRDYMQQEVISQTDFDRELGWFSYEFDKISMKY